MPKTYLAIISELIPENMAPEDKKSGTIHMSLTPFTKIKMQMVNIDLKNTLT